MDAVLVVGFAVLMYLLNKIPFDIFHWRRRRKERGLLCVGG
jgi:hypothetical protein